MAVLDPEGITVLTDTLATTPDGQPFLYCTKATPVPHMQLVMVGTGLGDLADRWAAFLRNRVRALDVEMLDVHTPAALRQLWRDLAEELTLPATVTATIYHLGVAQGDGQCRTYAYRSNSDFVSERLPDAGSLVKPEPAQPSEPDFASLDALIALAERVRTEQRSSPTEKRIHIGGELMLTLVNPQGMMIRRVHRFDDYESAWNSMCSGNPTG